jgi:hypothetical protein
MMEATGAFKTLVNFYQITRCYILEDSHLERKQMFENYSTDKKDESKIKLNCLTSLET